MKKVYDLAVKTGTYKKDGQDKARWKNVGVVMQGDDGGMIVLLERSFNPAGIPFKEGSETIMLSMFRPKENAGHTESAAPEKNTEVKDEIPF